MRAANSTTCVGSELSVQRSAKEGKDCKGTFAEVRFSQNMWSTEKKCWTISARKPKEVMEVGKETFRCCLHGSNADTFYLCYLHRRKMGNPGLWGHIVSSILFHTLLPLSFNSPACLKSSKQKCKPNKRKEKRSCSMQDVFAQGVSVSKRFYWKVVPLMMEFVHVCALKGIEAMSEIRKDYCLIQWSLIICPLKLPFLINKKIVAVTQRWLC